jgi:hypothetical protein
VADPVGLGHDIDSILDEYPALATLNDSVTKDATWEDAEIPAGLPDAAGMVVDEFDPLLPDEGGPPRYAVPVYGHLVV